MGQNSNIEWTHHTFNPWRGCTKVSDGCKNCYAETMSKSNLKVLGQWGPNGTRVIASESMWREPMKWNAAAAKAGERHRVFCASLADVFEGPETMPAASRGAVETARSRLFKLIEETPSLDWLLLTKRPENIMETLSRLKAHWMCDGLPGIRSGNVWLGTSVENQQTADERIPHLLRCPARVRFLSCEPLLGPVDLNAVWWSPSPLRDAPEYRGVLLDKSEADDCAYWNKAGALQWVIVGGESGPGARPCNIEWIRSIVRQCKAANVSVFVKQLGSNAQHDHGEPIGWPDRVRPRDPKGGDWNEWPADLRVREFPVVKVGDK